MEPLCQDKNRIAIVGGGPAGIYCALNLLKKFKEISYEKFVIHIFDKGQVLRTILPTGNGRCNITNSICDIREFASNYPRGEKFLYSLFSRHFNYDSLEFFKEIGINTYTQDDGRVFPISNSAKEVKDLMLEKIFEHKKCYLKHKEIIDVSMLENYSHVIFATGSNINSSLLDSLKHPYIPFRKALCSLVVENFNFPQGVSISTKDGDFVFTQNGISGPLAFKISSIKAFDKFPYEVEINLFDENKLYELIQKYPTKSIGNLVSMLLPRSFAKSFVKEFDKNSCEISKTRVKELSKLKLKIIGTSASGEIVKAGGIDLNCLDKNCHSKINNKFWFCGELLNIDGFCGGFNLQNCWSSASVVANDVFENIINKSGN